MSSEPGFWNRLADRRFTRRRTLAAAMSGSAAIMAGAACGQSAPKTGGAAPAGGGSAAAAGTPRSGGTLQSEPVFGSAPTLDLQQTSSAFAQPLVNVVMSRLMHYRVTDDPAVGQGAEPVPGLAVSLESPDAVTWTVKLRTDVKFHNLPPVNGHALEAEDVKASWTRALSQKNNPFLGAIDMIDASQITTPSKDTVVFKLKYPFAPLPAIFAATTVGTILPREALAGSYDPAKTVIGTGPFVFDSFTPDVEFVAKKNPDWYEKGRPYVDAVRVAIIPDQAQRLAQFSSRHLDISVILPNDRDAAQKAVPNARWIKSTPGSGNMFWFQLGDPTSVYQDIRIRRAFSMAIDRDVIGKAVFGGDYILGFNPGPSLGPKRSLTMDQVPASVAPYYKYNPAEAKKLLEAAGASNLSVAIQYPQPYVLQGFIPAVETVNSMLNAVGIKSVLRQIDYTKDYLGGGKGAAYGNFPKDVVVFSGIRGGSSDDPDGHLYDYFHSKSLVGAEHLNDPTLDAMIDRERTIINQEERWKACLDIQKYIADKMYMVAFLPQPYNYYAIQPTVKNYQFAGRVLGTETYSKLWLDR